MATKGPKAETQAARLGDRLKSMESVVKRRLAWIDRLKASNPEIAAELEYIRQCWQAGEYTLDKAEVYRRVQEEYPQVKVQYDAFRRWLDATPAGNK